MLPSGKQLSGVLAATAVAVSETGAPRVEDAPAMGFAPTARFPTIVLPTSAVLVDPSST